LNSDLNFTGANEIKQWHDTLPLRYRYSLGVSGQKFSNALKSGRLVAFECPKCGKAYIIPTLFCPDCFRETDATRDVPAEGRVYSFTSSGDETVVIVRFEGIQGGLIHRLKKGETVTVDDRVRVVFRPQAERTGDLTDITYFEKVS
jgi:uncharacterized OB-fold protein